MKATQSVLLFILLAVPSFAQNPAALKVSIDGAPRMESATGVIEKVFRSEFSGYKFLAYQITFQGAPVIVEDPNSSSEYSVGDIASFFIARRESPNSKKSISFTILPVGRMSDCFPDLSTKTTNPKELAIH